VTSRAAGPRADSVLRRAPTPLSAVA